eukprot:GSChrysophyteH2.ASY1.ANO1.102.1 assembled CDS
MEHRSKIDSVENVIRSGEETIRELQHEVEAGATRESSLEEKLQDQALVMQGLQERLEDAMADKQRVEQKREEVAQTVVWESKRYEDERGQFHEYIKNMEQQLQQLQYQNQVITSQSDEMKATNKALALTNTGLRESIGNLQAVAAKNKNLTKSDVAVMQNA